MALTDEPEVQEVTGTDPEPGANGSMLDKLREEYQKHAEQETIDLDVPGWDGMLVARYKLLDGAALGNIGDKVNRQFKKTHERNLYATIDSILQANEGMYFRNPEDAEDLTPIDPDPVNRGFAVTYSDPALLDAIGVPRTEVSSARDTVRMVFKGNEVAIIRHGAKLALWMGDTTKDVNEGFLGDF